MPRRNKINLTRQQESLIQELNKKVSDKKYRLRKKYGEPILNHIEDIETRGIQSFTSRNEAAAYIKKMQRFTNRNVTEYQFTTLNGKVVTKKEYNKQKREFVTNKYGVQMPRDLYNKIKKEIRRINAKKRYELNRIKDLPFIVDGEIKSTVGKQMEKKTWAYDKGKRLEKTEFNFDSWRFSSKKLLDLFLNGNEEEKGFFDYWEGDFLNRAAEDYRERLLKSIQTQFIDTGLGGQTLYEKIKNMSSRELMDAYYSSNFTGISWVYDKIEAGTRLSKMEESYNFDLEKAKKLKKSIRKKSTKKRK